MITIRDLRVINCGGSAIHLAGGIDGLEVDGLYVSATPVAVSATGPVRNAIFRRVIHHPVERQQLLRQCVGRNDPCWCGTGEKFKRCHGA